MAKWFLALLIAFAAVASGAFMFTQVRETPEKREQAGIPASSPQASRPGPATDGALPSARLRITPPPPSSQPGAPAPAQPALPEPKPLAEAPASAPVPAIPAAPVPAAPAPESAPPPPKFAPLPPLTPQAPPAAQTPSAPPRPAAPPTPSTPSAPSAPPASPVPAVAPPPVTPSGPSGPSGPSAPPAPARQADQSPDKAPEKAPDKPADKAALAKAGPYVFEARLTSATKQAVPRVVLPEGQTPKPGDDDFLRSRGYGPNASQKADGSADGPPRLDSRFMEDPPRVVVDVARGWTWGGESVQRPAHPLVKTVRIGREETRTRFVLDLAPGLTARDVAWEVAPTPSGFRATVRLK